MFTRRHYTAFSTALRKARPPVIPGSNVVVNEHARKTWYDACTQVALVLGEGNKSFDASRFFDDCGVPS